MPVCTRQWRRVIGLGCLIALIAFETGARAADAPLLMGVFPRRDAAETARLFTPMAMHLGKRLGREVKLVTAQTYDSFWKDVMEQRYDIVQFNQYHYIRSTKTYKVIGHTQEFEKNAIASVLYVRRDSGITQVSQLRGRTVIFGGGKDAMMSYIAPRYLLSQAGLKEGDFKTAIAVNPQNALVALFHKYADAAGGGEIALDQPVIKNAVNTGELRILASTEPLLFVPWAVKRTLPGTLVQLIQSELLNLHNSPTGKEVLKSALMTGIRSAEDKDYDPHRKMVYAVFGAKGAPN